MGHKERQLKHEALWTSDVVAEYVKLVAEGFRKGHITFTGSGRTIILRPKRPIHFELKVKMKNGKSKISLKCEWEDASPEAFPALAPANEIQKPEKPPVIKAAQVKPEPPKLASKSPSMPSAKRKRTQPKKQAKKPGPA